MEELTKNPTRMATKWAFLYLITAIVITYAFQLLNIDQASPAKYISYLPFFAYMFLAQKEHRDELGGYMSFGRGFSTGFRYALFSGLLMAVFIYIYLAFLSPEILDKAMAAQQSAMEDKGMTSDQATKAMEMGKKFGPLFAGFGTAVVYPLIGALVSLIGAAIFKKEAPMFSADSEPGSTLN